MILGSLQAHASTQIIDNQGGGANCPTIGTTDLGMPKIVEKMEEPFIAAARGREPQVLTAKRTEYGKQVRKQYESGELKASRHTMQQLEPRNDGVSNTLTSVEKDNYVCEPHIMSWPHGYNKGGDKTISPTVKSSAFAENNFVSQKYRIRKLTPRECFRLMGCDEPTIDKLLNAGISNSQLYKLAGNSIVVDVLTAIFDKMFVHTEQSKGDQLTLF